MASFTITADSGTFALTGVSVRLLTGPLAGRFQLRGQSVAFQAPGSRPYVTVVGGIVIEVTEGFIPSSTLTTLYYDITGVSPVPEVGWYFSEICQEFSATPPIVPPGDIAPPYPPGQLPPDPDDPNFPTPEDPGEDLRSHVLPTLITWAADGPGPTTIAAVPEALTPLPNHFHVAFDFTDVCYLRLQAEILEAASTGATLLIEYSPDNGVTWLPLKPVPEV